MLVLRAGAFQREAPGSRCIVRPRGPQSTMRRACGRAVPAPSAVATGTPALNASTARPNAAAKASGHGTPRPTASKQAEDDARIAIFAQAADSERVHVVGGRRLELPTAAGSDS